MTDYFFRHDHPTEAGRMDLMASVLDGVSRNQIARIPIQPDWHCLEIAAGNGSLSQWLAPQVPQGSVTATDINPDLLAGLSAPNLTVERLDLREGLPEERHDFIFLRALLHHLPEREDLIETLVRGLKKGGWLFIYEPDLHPLGCAIPELCKPLWDDYLAWTNTVDIDYTIGRRLPQLLQDNGMTDITVAGDTGFYPGGSPYAEWLRLSIAVASRSMLDAGLTTVETLEAFDKASMDPSVWHMTICFIGAAGQRPE